MEVPTLVAFDNCAADLRHIADITTSTEPTATDRFNRTKPTLSGAMAVVETGSAAAVTDIAAKLESVETQRSAAAMSITSKVGSAEAVRAAGVTSITAKVASANGEIESILAGTNAEAAAVIAGLRYLPPVAYAASLAMTLSRQTVSYAGATYAPDPAALPFNTSGTFETAKFFMVQSASVDALAGPSGAAEIGSGPGTVEDWIQETASVVRYGAVRSTTVNSQNAFDLAYAASPARIFVPPGDFLVTHLDYPKALIIDGPGRIFRAISEGLEQLNLYGDEGSAVVGLEYRRAFHDCHLVPRSRRLRGGFLGDSTYEGASVDVPFRPTELMRTMMLANSMQTDYGTDWYNCGFSGWDTYQLRRGLKFDVPVDGVPRGAPLAIILDLDILFVGPGVNDPAFSRIDGSAIPESAGQNDSRRRTVDDLYYDLDLMLTDLRGAKSVVDQTIVLEIPNCIADSKNGRDERWVESITPVYRYLARKHMCVLIDRTMILRDARRGTAGLWMDIYKVHPLNVTNVWLAQVRYEVCYPESLRAKTSKAGYRVIAGSEDVGDASRLPSWYGYGKTTSRALTGFPDTGAVDTTVSPDNIAMQWFFPFTDAARQKGVVQLRLGTVGSVGGATEGWSPFIDVGGGSALVVPAAGYQAGAAGGIGAMRVAQSGNHIVCEKFLQVLTPAVTPANTLLGTIPVWYRPNEIVRRVPISCYTYVGTWEDLEGQILPDGTITLTKTTTLPALRFYINAIWSKLP